MGPNRGRGCNYSRLPTYPETTFPRAFTRELDWKLTIKAVLELSQLVQAKAITKRKLHRDG